MLTIPSAICRTPPEPEPLRERPMPLEPAPSPGPIPTPTSRIPGSRASRIQHRPTRRLRPTRSRPRRSRTQAFRASRIRPRRRRRPGKERRLRSERESPRTTVRSGRRWWPRRRRLGGAGWSRLRRERVGRARGTGERWIGKRHAESISARGRLKRPRTRVTRLVRGDEADLAAGLDDRPVDLGGRPDALHPGGGGELLDVSRSERKFRSIGFPCWTTTRGADSSILRAALKRYVSQDVPTARRAKVPTASPVPVNDMSLWVRPAGSGRRSRPAE